MTFDLILVVDNSLDDLEDRSDAASSCYHPDFLLDMIFLRDVEISASKVTKFSHWTLHFEIFSNGEFLKILSHKSSMREFGILSSAIDLNHKFNVSLLVDSRDWSIFSCNFFFFSCLWISYICIEDYMATDMQTKLLVFFWKIKSEMICVMVDFSPVG